MSGQAFDEAAEEWLIWSVFERSGTGSRQESATKQKLERFQAKWAPVRVKKMRPNKRIRA
ncbi:hypothetical protein H8A97_37815 [Bradyrhizobium sp. Arg62]|uniref:hypothetical protein n=1 Tax=Bradyrhizobium brasilense TaxID=1419277 RepID=UPI001E477B61|nr:hypothetical protein [Bradyrhizobium brasilense]MCC8950670.1 hypothetical protein [Bradyrhizobium brasilense]